ncbi:SDR family oxidoreductase [Sinorhizobium medicae]|uniref:SDR family oxidoreductase n=1 Tax=Sinorhizobium medicae TaxID=110321 RepID=UPI000FD9177C|nr:SDR family oxidoreductase [Sinorhizobium medicae]RVO72942.1 SDR family oxidoreductase [Sinorhizobium medicae]
MTDFSGQIWLITGANKGLGAAIARAALARGCKVVAGARRVGEIEKALGTSPDLLPVALDITSDEQVNAAVGAALNKFGRIDVVVNNAGYGLLGYFEEMTDKQIRDQMETNVYGAMQLVRAALPAMRQQQSGLIVNVSSTSGIKSVEGGSVYSASKFAVEGWSEGLAIELEPFGIRTMIVEPGGMRTDFFNPKTSFNFAELEIADYEGQRRALLEHMTAMGPVVAGDPTRVAEAIFTALNAPEPPLRLLCGRYAVEAVDQYMTKRRNEFEAWRDVSNSTDFD